MFPGHSYPSAAQETQVDSWAPWHCSVPNESFSKRLSLHFRDICILFLCKHIYIYMCLEIFWSLISDIVTFLFWKRKDFANKVFFNVTHSAFFHKLCAIVTENNFNTMVILVACIYCIWLFNCSSSSDCNGIEGAFNVLCRVWGSCPIEWKASWTYYR